MRLHIKQVIAAYLITFLVINPALAQQQGAGLVQQQMRNQQARAIAEKFSVDRQASEQLAIQLENTAENSDTALKQSMNGTTVVDIATPSAKGVSKNNWNEFNVSEEGIIFNNSKGPVLTQLGGWSDGNRRLAGGEASIILNQVNGANRSTLLGQVEIAGQSAEFILANPNGITCNGCGFINTPAVSLITGQSRLDQNGDLIFDITQGDFLLEGEGIDATNLDRFDIVSRYAKINAALYANHVSLITGANQFNYQTKQIAGQTANAPSMQFALDSTALGGMYANRIQLIGTEKGLGVNLDGVVQSTDQLTISADGNIQFKQLQANNQIQVTSTSGDINNQSLSYAKQIDLNAANQIHNNGLLAASDAITLNAKQINQSGGLYAGLTSDNSLNNSGSLSLNASEQLINTRDIYVGGALNLQTPQINNQGTWVLQTQNLFNTQHIVNAGSIRFNNQDASIIADTITNTGDIQHLGSGLLSVTLDNNLLNQSGLLATNGNLSIVSKDLLNNDGQLFAKHASFTLEHLDNTNGVIELDSLSFVARQLNNSSGRIILQNEMADLSFTLENEFNNQSGIFFAESKSFSLAATQLDNQRGNFILSNSANADIHISGILNNQSGFLQTGDLLLNADIFDNTQGSWLSDANQSRINYLVNDQGFIQGYGMSLTGERLGNQAGVLLNLGSDQLLSLNFASSISNIDKGVIRNLGGNTEISTSGFFNNNGVVESKGLLNLELDQLINQQGSLQTDNQLKLNLSSLDNQRGYIQSQSLIANTNDWNNTQGYLETGEFNLKAATINNQQGYLLATDETDIQLSGDLVNQQGVIAQTSTNAIDKFSIQANQLQNSGEIISNAQIASINLEGELINSGVIENSQRLDLNANSISNDTGSITANQLNLSADVIQNNSAIANSNIAQGQIAADQITINTNEFTNSLYSLIYADRLTIKQNQQYTPSITNQGDLVADQIELGGDSFNNSGRIASATNNLDSLVFNFINQITNSGQISRNSDWSMTASQLNNYGRIESAGNGTIVAQSVVNTDQTKQTNNNASVNLDRNNGLIIANNLSINSSDINNRFGVLLANTGLLVNDSSNTQLNNQSGFIQSGSNDWVLNNIQLNNNSGTIWHSGNGKAEFNLLGNLDNTQGSIVSTGNLEIELQNNNSQLTNDQGLIKAKQLIISTQDSINNLNAGTLAANHITLNTNTLNNQGGIIEAIAIDSAELHLNAAAINNTNNGEIRSGATDWTLSLSQLNNDGGKIIHLGAGQLSLTSDDALINRGDLHSNGNLSLNLGSLDNYGRLSANNNLSLQTESGIINRLSGEISAENQSRITANNQTIVNQGYWFIGKQFDQVSSLEASEWINEGEWILGDDTTDSIDLTINRLSNSGWISYNNSGTFTLNATHIDNAGTFISRQGNLAFIADTINNSAQLHAANMNVDSMQLSNLGRVTSSGQVTLNTQTLVNQDQTRQLADNLSFDPNVDQGVILADQLQITANTVDNNFGALISQSNLDNSLLIRSRSSTPVNVNNNQGIVQSAANNWTLTNLQLTNIDGSWLHLGEGLADWSIVNSLNNTRGTLRSEGELILTSSGANNSLNNAGGVITANRVTIDSDDRIDNTQINGIAGTIKARSVILTATTINNDGGIIEANDPDTAQLVLNGQVNNINQGELRSAATDWSFTLDSINNQGGRILHTGSGSLNLNSTGEFINDGILYSAGQLTLTLDSLINRQQIAANNISIAMQNGIHNQANASIYASTETQFNAINQSINNDGEWYLGNSVNSVSLLTGSQWNNNGKLIIGALQTPSSNDVTFSLDEFNNIGILSYNNSGIFTINANKISNAAQSIISANNGSANFALTGVSDSSSGFTNSGDIFSNSMSLNANSSTQSWMNRGRLQASQFTFTNADLFNDTNGILFGTSNNSVFTFNNNSQLTNNGKWYNNATSWTLNDPLGSGEFFHLGTGNLALTFNTANSLADTTYISTAGTATIGGTIQGSIAAANNPQGDLRTTIVAQGNITLTNNLVNHNAAIHSYSDIEVSGNLDNSGRISATQQLFTSNNAQADLTNSGEIKANQFALTVNQLINSGDLLALGKLANSNSSIVGNSINNQNGLIQIDNATGNITATQNIVNNTGVIAKNNSGSLTLTTNTLDNTDGLIAAEQGNLVLTVSGDLINSQNPNQNPITRGIYANELTLTANLLNNQSGVISINSIDNVAKDNSIRVNDLDNNGGTIQLSHFNRNPTLLDSLTLIAANSVDNQNGSIQLLNVIDNLTPDQYYPGPLRNTAGDTELNITTASINNQNGTIASDGRLTINSQNSAATKTLLSNAGNLQARNDLTLNAAGLNNTGSIVGVDNAAVTLNLNGFNLTNTGANADIFSFNQLTINANQINNAQKIRAKNQLDITTQSFSGVGTIQSGNLLNINLQSDLVLGLNDTLAAPGALSITTPGDITNAGTISAVNYLLLNADNLLNDTTGNLVAGAGSQASEFRINTQLLNRGLISSLGDLNIITPEFVNTNGGRLVTGNLTFDLMNTNTGSFTNEGSIYSRGDLDILNANSVVNQDNATMIAVQSMQINTNGLLNDQSRIETLIGDLTLNITTSLINRSAFDPNAISKSYLSYEINRRGFADEVPYYTDVIDNGGGYYDEIYITRYTGNSRLGIIQSANQMNILGSANIFNEYGNIYSGGDLQIDGATLNQDSQALGQITERLFLNSTAGPRVCGPFQTEPSCYNIPAFYYSGSSDVIDMSISSTYGYIRSGGSITGNLSQGLNNGNGEGTFNCNSSTDPLCQSTNPNANPIIDSSFTEALNNLLPDEFNNIFGLNQKQQNINITNAESQNANPDAAPDLADAADGAEAVNANSTNDPNPRENKTLADVQNSQAADGSGTNAQTSNFIGETGDAADAANKDLLANAGETNDQLTQNIPETIAKANAQPLKGNQWPLISFSVLPFNFDLKNLSGLYVVSQNPDSKYLIETRPEFTLYENFLGSDYLLEALGYDADKTIKRLGDAFFENMLIRDALIKETNSRYLTDATNDFDTMQTLMNNAVAAASSLQLTIGVELTPEQCAALTQDMMWLVKKKINGQEVLVPHLYLTTVSPEKIAASKAAIGANGSVSLSANTINNQSSIYAGQNLSLTADLLRNTNTLGAGGNLLLATRGNLEQDGRLFAQGDVRLLAAGSMSINGKIDTANLMAVSQDLLTSKLSSQLNISGNLLLQSTDNDVVFESQKSTTEASTKNIKANSVQYTTGHIKAGGNIVVDAGRDIQAQGTDFTAGKNINLHADRDVNLQAMKSEDNYEYTAKRKKEIHKTTEHDVVNINAGGNVVIDAGRDNNLTGTNIAANDDVFISADRDTNISAVVDSDYDYSYSKKKKSFGRSKTKIDETLVEDVVGGTIVAGGNVLINAHVNADGKLITDASGKVNILGAVISANENVVISGDEDVNISGIQYESMDYHQKKKSGFGGFNKKDEGAAVANQLLENASVSAGKNIHLLSGNDLNLVAADVVSDGNINMEAVNQLLVAAGEVKTQAEEWKNSSGLFTNGDIYNKKEHKSGEMIVSGKASTIAAGGKVNATVGSAKIIGSTISGDQSVSVIADAGDIEVTTYQQHLERYSKDKEVSVGLGDLVDQASRPDQWIEDKDGRASLTFANASYDDVEKKTKVLDNQASTIKSNGDLTLIATAGSVGIQGSDITADADQLNGGQVGLAGATGVSITEASNSYESHTKETHGSAEMSVVVQHQAVEVVKAAQAVDDAKDKLEQAKRDYKNYERNLDQLETQLTQLESDLNNKTPGVSVEDVMELRELIGDLKDDKEFYQTGIALAAVNLTSSITALTQQTAAAAASVGTWGFNAGVQLDVDASKTTTNEKETTARGSNVSGNKIVMQTGTLDASGKLDTANTQTTIRGSNITATQSKSDSGELLKSSIVVETGDLNILSSKNTSETKTKTEQGHITVQQTIYGSAGGASMNGSYNRNQSTDKSTTINNSKLDADTIELTTSNDLNIRGGNVRANDHLDVDVGGNLTLESQQNRSNSRNTGLGISGGVSFGSTGDSKPGSQNSSDVGSASGVNAGINTNNGMSVTRETVLTSISSGGTANVKVKGTTYNTGALLATTDVDGKDLGNLNFETGDYVSTDLRNIKQNNQTSVGVSTNMGVGDKKPDNNPREGQQIAEGANGKTLSAQTSNLTYSNTNENSASKSLATLGHGNITVGGVQLERDGILTDAGKADGSVLIGINRDTENTEKTLWDSSQSQTVDATLDHRLLNEDGQKEIKEDFKRSEILGESIVDLKDESVSLTGKGDGETGVFEHIDTKQKYFTATKNFITNENNSAHVKTINDGNATPEAKQAAYTALANSIATEMGISPVEAMILVQEDSNLNTPTYKNTDLNREITGAAATKDNSGNETGKDLLFVVDDNIKTTGEAVNTVGHEMDHLIKKNQDTGVKIKNQALYDSNSESYANLMGDATEDYLGFNFSNNDYGTFGTTNLHNGSTTSNSLIAHNNNLFNNLDSSKVDYRQLKFNESEALDQGIKVINARLDLTDQEKAQAAYELGVLACGAVKCSEQLPDTDLSLPKYQLWQAQGEALINQGYGVDKTLNALGVKTTYQETALAPGYTGATITNALFFYSPGDALSDLAASKADGFNAAFNKFENIVLNSMAAGLILDVNPTTGMIAPENQRMSEEWGLKAINEWNTPRQSNVGEYMTNSMSPTTWQDSPNYILDTAFNGLDIIPLAGTGAKVVSKGFDWTGDLLRIERTVDNIPEVNLNLNLNTPEQSLQLGDGLAALENSDQPLLLTQLDRTAPEKYTLVKNSDGTFTMNGPKTGIYESTPYYTADGVPIYKSKSGKYYAMDENGIDDKVGSPYPNVTLTDRARHHNQLVDDISNQLKDQGYTVGNEVNISNLSQDGLTRTDIVYVRQDNSVVIVEIKTGNAPNTPRQNEIFPQIQSGDAIITEQLAAMLNSTKKFDVKPGQTLREAGFPNGIPVYQLRGNRI